MAWKTLAESLESALASMLEEQGCIGRGTQSPKGTDPEGPAKFQEIRPTQRGEQAAPVTTQPGKAPASSAEGRGRATHHQAPPQRRVARPMLSVIEGGGGRPAQGGASRAAYRATTGRERVREFLRLVVG